jgi:hypothetical protein
MQRSTVTDTVIGTAGSGKSSYNTYISAKRVKQFTDNRELLGEGTLRTGQHFAVGLDTDHPALLILTGTSAGETLRLRLDLSKLVESLVAAEAADADRWEPLRTGTQEGWWGNSILSAHVTHHGEDVIHISYHRRDRAPIRDWRIGQRLKNELAGPEYEGIEIYPAESRLVDTSNEYHLWCVPWAFPLGFDYRDLATQDQIDQSTAPDAIQRDDPDADTSEFDGQVSDDYRPVRVPNRPESAD